MKTRVMVAVGALTTAWWVALGAGAAHANPYIPHVPGLPGVPGIDIGLPPPGHINQWLPPPGQVKQWVPGPEDLVPNWH